MTLANAIMLAQDAAPAAEGTAWIAAGFVLLAAALVLGFLELFVPTGGVLAVATAACLLGSVVAFFMHGMLWGFAALLAYSAGAPFAVVLGFKLWSRTPIARRMVLAEGEAPAAPGTPDVAVGSEGVALTPLRPVGFVRIGTLRIEANAEMGLIEAGAGVVVSGTSGGRVTVRARG